MKLSEDELFDQQEKEFAMFNKYNGWRTCKTCAYAMPFSDSIVCGVWHSTFSYESFCDKYKTQDERNEELEVIKQRHLADPNSLYNRLKNKKK